MSLPINAEGGDLSEWQIPANVNFASRAFWIIRASHGVTEDKQWRGHFNACVAAGRPLGLYHYLEATNPAAAEAEAVFFRGLVGFLRPEQVALGFWCDSEVDGQSEACVDAFRAACELFAVGVYSNLAGFNERLPGYEHFGLNWLAMPTGTTLPAGWTVPDHVLLQDGLKDGLDHDVLLPAQPYPSAWG